MAIQSAIRNPQSTLPPVGVFDSGVGGLTVTRELMAQYPGQPLIYLADQAHAPYGQRALPEIRALAAGVTRFLLDQGARVIVIACNTASAAALRWLRAQHPEVPFVGMEPAVKPAAERSRARRVGVMATAATFQGELFASLVSRYASGVTVQTQVCADLVPLVEAGETNSETARQAVIGYLAPLLAAGIDELVLGCTHYPFLRPLIEEAAGPGVEIIDPAPAVARQTGRVLAAQGWPVAGRDAAAAPSAGDSTTHHIFYTTGDPDRFRAALVNLLGVNGDVRQATWSTEGRLTAAMSATEPPKLG
jgi:glutamate racemase